MNRQAAEGDTNTEDEEKARRRERNERLTRMMWAYICGAIVLLSNVVGLEASFIPPGFGILGLILAWQLFQKEERRHSVIAGALNLGGILIWLTYNWPTILRFAGS